MIQVEAIADDLRAKYNSDLLKFEEEFTYPFGKDRFRINHGKDYFNFFDLIGKPYIFVAFDKDKIVGIAIFVLRDQTENPFWYICDLKIAPEYRGKGIAELIFLKAIKCKSISDKIYGISMDSQMGENKLINFSKKLKHLSLERKETLFFYIVQIKELETISKYIEKRYGPYGFLSLSGTKDLVMQSNQEIYHLLHIVPEQKSNKELSEIACPDIMFCAESSSLTHQKMQELGIRHACTASVISNMDLPNWDWILSSEI